ARALASYQHYIGKMFWPSGLMVPFLRPTQWAPWTIPSAVALVTGFTLLAVWLGRRFPSLPVGWFWYVGTLLPVVGAVPVGAHLFADRYTYFPIIGLFIALTWGALEMTARWKFQKEFLGATAAVVLLGCMAATNVQ